MVRARLVHVLFVGEAPGAAEDAAGTPFVGKSGQLLDRLLAEVGLVRDRVAVANVLKCRPPGNRKPRAVEVENCRPWLTRQISLADPSVVCTLGGTAAEWMFGRGVRIASLRLSPQTYDGRRVVTTYHPSAAILRSGGRTDGSVAGGPRAGRAVGVVNLAVEVPDADAMRASVAGWRGCCARATWSCSPARSARQDDADTGDRLGLGVRGR